MSVYIHGMEMPKGCCGCPIDSDSCKLWVKVPVEKLREKRPKDCPLVSVPDHGDLIDRDKLEKDIENYIGGEESRSRFHHWVQVQDAVIPMDKGEEK